MRWPLALIGLALAQDPERAVLVELEGIETALAAMTVQVGGLEARLAQSERAATENRTQLTAAQDTVARHVAGAKQRAVALYRLKHRGISQLLFGARSPSDLRRRIRYLAIVLRADEVRARLLTEAIAERTRAEERVAADIAVTRELHAQLTEQLAGLETRREARRAFLRQVRSRPELVRQAYGDREAAGRELAPAPVAMTSTGDFGGQRGALPSPVSGKLFRGFGPYHDPLTGEPLTNTGIDIAAPLGTPVRAVFGGVVRRSGYAKGFGQFVAVQHDDAHTTIYAHCNGLRAVEGQSVAAGEILATVGSTGLIEDDKPRLHFEVRYHGSPQDPTDWLVGYR